MSDTRDMLSVDRAASGDVPRDDVRATLDAWRAAGAERIDPLRFAMIDALAQRVSGRQADGELRRLLEGRLAALLAAYARDVEAMREDREDREGHPRNRHDPLTRAPAPLRYRRWPQRQARAARAPIRLPTPSNTCRPPGRS